MERSLEGKVIKSTGSWYEILQADQAPIKARLKGKLRLKGLKSTNPVAVGDFVTYEIEGEEALITDIKARKNYIIRKSINLSKQVQIIAANVDVLFLMVTIEQPITTLGFIDRFLVGAEAYRIPTVILFNKVDVLNSPASIKKWEDWKKLYQDIGYSTLDVCATEGKGVEELKELMQGKTSIFAGHSGVGKSTLVNQLDANLNLKTNEISEYHASGKHTTTYAELFSLPFGAEIIDTPGIKGFGNVEIDKAELAHFFPEFRAKMNACKFSNCIHINEPSCAIKQGIEDGELAASRYHNYCSMLEDDESETFRAKGY